MRTPHIPISRNHSVGTEAHEYRLADDVLRRSQAIKAGIAAREESMTPKDARESVRKRLNALRIVNRRREHCDALDNDYAWVTQLVEGASATPACMFYPHEEPTVLRAKLGTLLYAWFAGPWSYRIADGRARLVLVPSLLEQNVARSNAQNVARSNAADTVQKGGSFEAFTSFLNHLVVDANALARRIARERTPKRALQVLAEGWRQAFVHEDGEWRLALLHSCPRDRQDCSA